MIQTKSSNAFFLRLVVLSFLLQGGFTARTQPLNYYLGARFDAMSNATVMIPDLWSVSHNQAGIAWVTSPSVGFHFENKFAVPQYALSALSAVIPTGHGSIGTMMYYFGYSMYHDIRVGIAYGHSFSERFAAGIQLNYINTYIADAYGSYHSVVAEGGIMAIPVENLYLGVHVYNFTASKMSDPEREPLPVIFRMGMGYQFQQGLFVSVETEKEKDHKAVFKTGAEFNINKTFFLRAGYSTNPGEPSFGFGFLLYNFRADIAVTLHPTLGFTPFFSLMHSF
ncbi:MAG: hypothetical protein J7K46_10290 [Bacteroidales bacterium]|nr:hypothetical protein [Bacteroidales bacterium]